MKIISSLTAALRRFSAGLANSKAGQFVIRLAKWFATTRIYKIFLIPVAWLAGKKAR